MLYRFVERNDIGIETIARADVRNGMARWSGFQVETIRDLLGNTKWRQLRHQTFDEDNLKHWNQLPKLLTGSRLWVEVNERESNLELKQQEPDTTLRAASSRLPMWINRYTEVVNTAKIMAGADRKLKWVLGPTEHCSSCLKLAGKVKRGSVWIASGIQPQSRSLECGGFNCQCSLQPTTDRASAGRLPSIP
jgi:hypothetical protein